MRLLMAADTLGGVWTYALELTRALEPHGVEVALATMGAGLTRDQRAEIREIPNIQVYESDYKLEWMRDPWNDVAAAGAWLLDLAAAVQPDVVHLNNYVHAACAWNAPVLVVGHSCVLSWYEAVRGKPAGREWNRYRKEVGNGLRAADMVVAPTRAMLDLLDRHYGPLTNCRAIWNGVQARSSASRQRAKKEAFLFAAGRLWDEAKNIASLARVSGRLPWPVVVAGDASHPDGGRPRFVGIDLVGQLSTTAMAHYYTRAAIYVLPARYEPFGLTPLEAASAGCALVLGDIPFLRELWSGAAVFVPPDDGEALVSAIEQLAPDTAYRETYAARARRRAAQLTSQAMAGNYMRVYRELLRTKQRPAGHWQAGSIASRG
jgi:glycogen synthase